MNNDNYTSSDANRRSTDNYNNRNNNNTNNIQTNNIQTNNIQKTNNNNDNVRQRNTMYKKVRLALSNRFRPRGRQCTDDGYTTTAAPRNTSSFRTSSPTSPVRPRRRISSRIKDEENEEENSHYDDNNNQFVDDANDVTAGETVYHHQNDNDNNKANDNNDVTRTSGEVVDNATSVWDWLENDCCRMDDAIVIKIISYAGGPRCLLQYQRYSDYWKYLLNQQSTWKMFCEELYKWKPTITTTSSEEEEDTTNRIFRREEETSTTSTNAPLSWKYYYFMNPYVPIDFDTIEEAIQYSSQLILLQQEHPQKQQLRQQLALQLEEHERNQLRLEPSEEGEEMDSTTMRIGKKHNNVFDSNSAETNSLLNGNNSQQSTTIRVLLKPGNAYYLSNSIRIPVVDYNSRGSFIMETIQCNKHGQNRGGKYNNMQCYATVRSDSGFGVNQPMFCLVSGILQLRNVILIHVSDGTDIWCDNSAICIAFTRSSTTASLVLENVSITSHSGRGIAATANDPSHRINICINNSCIENCAATGIYVSAFYRGCLKCYISNTDIIHNGIGTPSGINAGHSGIYIDGMGNQTIVIDNCNISDNETAGVCFCFQSEETQLLLLKMPMNNSNNIESSMNYDNNINNINGNNDDYDSQRREVRQKHITFGMMNSSIIMNKLEQLQVLPDRNANAWQTNNSIHIDSDDDHDDNTIIIRDIHELLYNVQRNRSYNNEISLLGTPQPRSVFHRLSNETTPTTPS